MPTGIHYTTTGSTRCTSCPFTGGFPDKIGAPPDAFKTAKSGSSSPSCQARGQQREEQPQVYCDNPNRPRGPRSLDADVDAQRSSASGSSPAGSRMRFCWTCMRETGFLRAPDEEPLGASVQGGMPQRSRESTKTGDGVIRRSKGTSDTAKRRFPDNTRLFLLRPSSTRLRGDPRDQRRPVGAAVPPSSGAGCCRARLSRSSRRSLPRSVAMRTTGEAAEPEHCLREHSGITRIAWPDHAPDSWLRDEVARNRADVSAVIARSRVGVQMTLPVIPSTDLPHHRVFVCCG